MPQSSFVLPLILVVNTFLENILLTAVQKYLTRYELILASSSCRTWRGSSKWVRFIPSALHSRWEDHCSRSHWHITTLRIFCLLLLWPGVRISLTRNLLCFEVRLFGSHHSVTNDSGYASIFNWIVCLYRASHLSNSFCGVLVAKSSTSQSNWWKKMFDNLRGLDLSILTNCGTMICTLSCSRASNPSFADWLPLSQQNIIEAMIWSLSVL